MDQRIVKKSISNSSKYRRYGFWRVTFLLDSDYNIATRSGIHCSPLAHTTLGTLKQGAVRFSIGYFNTKDEIDKAVEALKKFQNK